MFKKAGMFGATLALLGVLAVEAAEARDVRGCGSQKALGTALGAVFGGLLGTAINPGRRGDTAAGLGGAALGGLLGNVIAGNRCNDNRYDAYHRDRAHQRAVS